MPAPLASGCDLSVYSNALGAIHTILKRLAEASALPGKLDMWVRSANTANPELWCARTHT